MVQRVRIGETEVAIVADNSELIAALKENTAALNQQDQAFDKSGDAVDDFSRRLDIAAAAFVAFATVAAGFAVNEFAQFEDTITRVGVTIGATEEQFNRLSDVAQDLGSTTRFSANEAAEGLQFLAQAGFEAEQAISALPSTLDLAQIGMLGLGDAADIASNILTGFGLAADLERIVDVIARTATSANTNVQQLGSAFSFVAPSAAALNVAVEETAAAIGVLSNAGIQGARAGTALRQILNSLVAPTKAGAEALRQAGLNAEDYNVRALGLEQVLQNLADANITLEQATAVFNSRNAASVLAITRSIREFRRLAEANRDAAGAAEDFVDALDQTLIGALRNFGSAVSGIAIAFVDISGAGNSLRVVILDIAEAINDLQERTRDADNILRRFADGAIAALEGLGAALVFAADNAEVLAVALAALVATRVGVGLLAIVTGLQKAATAAAVLAGTGGLAAVLSIIQKIGPAITLAFKPLLVGGAVITGVLAIVDALNSMRRATNALGLTIEDFSNRVIDSSLRQLETLREDLISDIERLNRSGAIALGLPQQTERLRELQERLRIVNQEIEGIREGLATPFAISILPEPATPEPTTPTETAPVVVSTIEAEAAAEALNRQLESMQRQVDLQREINDLRIDAVRSIQEQTDLLGLEGGEREAALFRQMAYNDLLDRQLQAQRDIEDAQRNFNTLFQQGGSAEAIREARDALLSALQAQEDLTAATAGYEQQVEATAERVRQEFDRLESLQNFRNTVTDLASAFSDFITSSISGAKDLGDALRDLANRVLQNLIAKFIEAQIEALLLGSAFGGVGPGIGSLFGFQQGGRPPPGVPVLVGESGAELFVADQPGTIIPNHQLRDFGSGPFIGNLTVNVPRDEPGMRRAVADGIFLAVGEAESRVATNAGRPSRLRDRIRR